MLITATNVSSDLVFISTVYTTLVPGESLTWSRTISDLDQEIQLKQLVLDGKVTLSFIKEPTDEVAMGWNTKMLNYTNLTRPLATAVPAYTEIYNTDDLAINISDGTNWRDAAGNLT